MVRKKLKNINFITKFVMIFSIILIIMFIVSFQISLISLIAGIVTLTLLGKWNHLFDMITDIIFYTEIISFSGVLNSLFSHKGCTIFLFINGKPITKEAVFYGITIGISFISVIIWFEVASILIKKSDYISIFGIISPKTAMIVTMILGIIPKIKNKYYEISEAQRFFKMPRYYNKPKIIHKIFLEFTVFSSTTSWAIENAIDTAISMKSKNYGISKRTLIYSKFCKHDFIYICIITVLLLIIIITNYLNWLKWSIYPYISIPQNNFIGTFCYLLLTMLPSLIIGRDRLKWNLFAAKS